MKALCLKLDDPRVCKWLTAGLLIGFLIGAIRLWAGPQFTTQSFDDIDQSGFERLMASNAVTLRSWEIQRQKLAAGAAAAQVPRSRTFRNLIVHPPLPDDADRTRWVTGELYFPIWKHEDPSVLASPESRVEQWIPFRFPSSAPFRARTANPGEYASVLDYLQALQRQVDPELTYSYAWWETPLATATLPVGICGLSLGIVVPLLLQLANGRQVVTATEAPPKREPASSPKKKTKKSWRRTVDLAAVEALNAQLAAGLDENALTTSAREPAKAAASKPTAAVLSGGSEIVNVPPADQEDTELVYLDYYPVVRHKEGKKQ